MNLLATWLQPRTFVINIAGNSSRVRAFVIFWYILWLQMAPLFFKFGFARLAETVEPNIITHSSLIGALATGQEWQKAMQHFATMRSQVLLPNRLLVVFVEVSGFGALNTVLHTVLLPFQWIHRLRVLTSFSGWSNIGKKKGVYKRFFTRHEESPTISSWDPLGPPATGSWVLRWDPTGASSKSSITGITGPGQPWVSLEML